MLLRVLSANPMALKQQQPRVAAHITGTLANLICSENESSAAKHIFAKAGGLEICCKVGDSAGVPPPPLPPKPLWRGWEGGWSRILTYQVMLVQLGIEFRVRVLET